MRPSMGDPEFLRAVEVRLARTKNRRAKVLGKADAVRMWSIARLATDELESSKRKWNNLQGLTDSRTAQVKELSAEGDKLRHELAERSELLLKLRQQVEAFKKPMQITKTINESIAGIGRELREAVYVCNNSGMVDAALAFQHVVVALGAAEDAAAEADAGDAVLEI